jgi:hypothetical protein
MSTPAETRSARPAVRTDEAARPDPAVPAARLAAWCDPEWLWFLGFGLLPAGLCGLLGQPQKASFFFGTAAFAAALKWLGWVALGRGPAAPRPGLAFPAHLFAGLAAACAWFYVRNVVGMLWPASYGLHELAVLPPLLTGLHLVGAARRALARPRPGWRLLGREALDRAALYLPFWGALAVVLWRVGGSLSPQTDGIFHACAARAYVEVGLFRPHPFLGETWPYPSGFGALNAVAASLAPLTVAQAVNLQHVFWLLAALFLLALAPALLAGRWCRALALAPPAFVALVPLYGLFPDYDYTATPRQLAAALLAAAGVLPLLAPARGAWSLTASAAVVGVLGALAAAMNPVGVPYAAFVLMVALAVFAARARRTPGRSIAAAIALPALPFLVAAALVGFSDPFFRPLLFPSTSAATATGEVAPADPVGGFSAGAGLRAALSPGKELALAENATVTRSGDEEKVLGWPGQWPYRAFPVCALLAAGGLAGWVVVRRRRGAALPQGVAALAGLAAGYVAAWFICKVGVTFGIGALQGEGRHSEMLRAYLGFLLLRWELMLFFAVVCAVGLALQLLAEQADPRWSRLAPLAWTAAGLLVVLPALSGQWMPAGVRVMHLGATHVITADDLALVAWCDEHLPADKGLIGMAARAHLAGPGMEEKHLAGLGGMPAFILYGKQGNYCFTLATLEASRWFDGYLGHVKSDFDAGWCLENGVHYFYISPIGLRENPGLARAIARGQLRLLHAEGESAIYEVVKDGGV